MENVPMNARRVWNKNRPMKKPKKTIANEKKVPDQSYPTKANFAPGVPNDKNLRRGYYPPDANPTKKRGGSGDTTTDGSYPPGGHASYGAS